jgi:P pilus assembly chaperone PapD
MHIPNPTYDKNNSMRLTTTIRSTLFVILGLWLSIAQAGFQISPMVIEINTTRGMASGMINVKNMGSETAHLRVYSEPFTYGIDGFKSLKTSPQDLSHYLVYAPRQLRIRPGQKRRIRLNVRFLPSTKPGEYRAMVFTEEVKTQASDQSQVGVVPRIGTAVYVRHGNVKPQLSVQSATYEDKQIVLRANNTGQATARPRVNWVLKKSWREIASGSSNKQTVIAEGQRNLKIGGEKFPEIESLRAGTYQISGELAWGAREENSLSFKQRFVVR